VLSGSARLRISLLDLTLLEPFTSTRGTTFRTTHAFIHLTSQGKTGIGEAGPLMSRGESLEQVLKELSRLEGFVGSIQELRLVEGHLRSRSARCAVDVAIVDLLARLQGVPLWDLLGLERPQVTVSARTLSVGDPKQMVERAAKYRDWPLLKVKIGFEGDIQTVRKIRRVYPGRLWLDANGCWNRDQARSQLEKLENCGIEMIEQPVRPGSMDDLAAVAAHTAIPVVADESFDCISALSELSRIVAGVSVKTRKLGGIIPALEAATVAKAHHLLVVAGSNLGSGVAVTADAFAAALADYADLDGTLFLDRDPYPGLSLDRGRVVIPDGPGLGVGVVES
jgi:L-alanine-DL-glutamate epimerase-like enolase superfamily enzyme